MKTRRIYRQIGHSKIVGVGEDSPVVGFGFAIIPNDMDRSTYINRYYKTGLCMIVSTYNEVIKDVRVPLHLLQEIQFPQQSGAYGSLVSWNCQPVTNQISLTGIHQGPGKIFLKKENVWTTSRTIAGKGRISTITDLNTKTHTINSRNDESVEGGISLISSSEVGKSKFSIYNNGSAILETDDKLDVVCENQISIKIGSEKPSHLTIDGEGNLSYTDQHENTVRITQEGILQEAKLIQLGKEAEQEAMLSGEWKTLQEKLIQAIQSLTVPTALGPSGTPINTQVFSQIAQELDKVKSKKVTLE